MFTMTYPHSRIKSSGQCNQCRGTIGNFIDKGIVTLNNADGSELKLLRWSCNYCGYTMLFDYSVIAQTPFRGSETEEVPDLLK